MKKILLLGLLGLGACMLPPQTEPRREDGVVIVYSPDYRYQNYCWTLYCPFYRPRMREESHRMEQRRHERVEAPRRTEQRHPEQRRAEPRHDDSRPQEHKRKP